MDREELFAEYQRLVRPCVRAVRRGAEHDPEVMQHALIGLWEACRAWDGKRSFSAFARVCIRHNVLDCLRAQSRRASRTGAGQLTVQERREFQERQEFQERREFQERQGRCALRELIRRATPARSRERRVLFSLLAGKSKDSIARRLGVSRRTVQRLAVRGWALVEAAKEEQEG